MNCLIAQAFDCYPPAWCQSRRHRSRHAASASTPATVCTVFALSVCAIQTFPHLVSPLSFSLVASSLIAIRVDVDLGEPRCGATSPKRTHPERARRANLEKPAAARARGGQSRPSSYLSKYSQASSPRSRQGEREKNEYLIDAARLREIADVTTKRFLMTP